jgi:hypothetical protein
MTLNVYASLQDVGASDTDETDNLQGAPALQHDDRHHQGHSGDGFLTLCRRFESCWGRRAKAN